MSARGNPASSIAKRQTEASVLRLQRNGTSRTKSCQPQRASSLLQKKTSNQSNHHPGNRGIHHKTMNTEIKAGNRVVATFDDQKEAIACIAAMARALRTTLSAIIHPSRQPWQTFRMDARYPTVKKSGWASERRSSKRGYDATLDNHPNTTRLG